MNKVRFWWREAGIKHYGEWVDARPWIHQLREKVAKYPAGDAGIEHK